MIQTTLRELIAASKAVAPSVRNANYITVTEAGLGATYLEKIVEYEALDSVAFADPVRFNLNGWVSPIFASATYGEILMIFGEALKDLGDEHHIFFEGFDVKLGAVAEVELWAGS